VRSLALNIGGITQENTQRKTKVFA